MCSYLEPKMPEEYELTEQDDDFDGEEYLRDKEIQEELWRERQE